MLREKIIFLKYTTIKFEDTKTLRNKDKRKLRKNEKLKNELPVETVFHKLFLLPALLVHCGVWSLQAKWIDQSLRGRSAFVLWGAYGMCQMYGIERFL